MTKILFISHDAHRAGAQILVLNYLRWLKIYHPEFEFSILLNNGGELKTEFENIAQTFQWNISPKVKYLGRFLEKSIERYHRNRLLKKLTSGHFDLIYSNTIMNGDLLYNLSVLKAPVVTHVHELEHWIQKSGPENIRKIKALSTYYIAASNYVKNYLVQKLEINEDQIKVIYEHVTSKDILNSEHWKNLKQRLNIPDDSLIIGASGAESWRKGKDWFIPLAEKVLVNLFSVEVHFVWIGGNVNDEIDRDLKRSKFKEHIHFINHLPNANMYFHDFDIFTMLSREDPFPVVNLEAALVETPILCFENSGGTPELIENNAGFVLPYGDIEAVAEKIIILLNNPDLRKKLGKNAKIKVMERYEIDKIGRQINDFLNSIIE